MAQKQLEKHTILRVLCRLKKTRHRLNRLQGDMPETRLRRQHSLTQQNCPPSSVNKNLLGPIDFLYYLLMHATDIQTKHANVMQSMPFTSAHKTSCTNGKKR